ncbi:Hypothetical protein NTJ_06182 [Nesidiocoris tenuis]|uniref:MD-2-related lipid-recognition domain-containing protein n=2 Tax=Nesidiocoris tenuis TaxID=355587 RepID=A0ABN7AMB4_9HEMI|nr:Hypothetical protein NTJ_06182 [Nesidiocoris tenuis]
MRCKSSSGRDCVTLLKYKHPDICPSLASKTSLWGAFVSHIKPSLLCPIKQNRYRIENATFDGDKFSSYFQAVPGEQNKVTYFILKLFSNQNNEDVACLDIMFRVLRP